MDRQSARSAESQARHCSGSNGVEHSPITPRLLNALAVLGFALAAGAYFWLIHHYGVNTIWADQWYNVDLIGHPLSFSALWAQHSEHRVFFPNLIVVVLAHTTHLNIVFEEYLSAVLLCGAVGLVILADKRWYGSTPWICYVPVPFVFLSFVQAGSTLFGFQLAWYLGILALAVALFLLDASVLTKLALIGAIAAAVVGSFSVFEGLFIWPIGVLVLYRRRASWGTLLAWIASAAITAIAFFHNYSWVEESSYWFTHPATALKFFFLALGDVVGAQLHNPDNGNEAVLVLGVLIFALACWVIVNYGLRPKNNTGSSIGVALVCFGLLFAATFTVGRVDIGLSSAGDSQYTTFDLLILVGCYLALLHPTAPLSEARRSERLAWPILRIVVVGSVLLQIVLGTINGLTQASQFHRTQTTISDITANIDRAPDILVESEVLGSPARIRKWAQIAETHHLSLFGTDAAATYRKEGLFPDLSVLSTTVLTPASGAQLSGTVLLDAAASDDVNVTRVTYSLSTASQAYELIGTATGSLGGWFYHWNTRSVANGTYLLRSEAYAGNGKHGYSPAITVTVRN